MSEIHSQSNDSYEPRIDQLVGFLIKADPDSLLKLKGEFPEFVDQLRPGQPMGSPRIELRRIRFLRKTAISSLTAAIKQTESDLKTIIETLKAVKRLETVSELITIAGSSLTAVLLAAGFNNKEPLVSSILTLCGGLASTLAKRYLLGLTGRGDMIETYRDGSSLLAEMTSLKTDLDSYIVSASLDDKDFAEIGGLIKRANEAVKLVFAKLLEVR